MLRALARVPEDLRALNLLALVRFKVGRLDEARATYREIAARAPNDPAVRRNLGLLALKAERADEAVAELELAAHLAPDDKRSWSYLGYAYTRFGDAVAAAAAFRRAGQDAVADELEAARPPTVIADAPAAVAPAPEPPHVAVMPEAAVGAARARAVGLAGVVGVVDGLLERRGRAPLGGDARGAHGVVRDVVAGPVPRQWAGGDGQGGRADPAVGARRRARARRRRDGQRRRFGGRARRAPRARPPERRVARFGAAAVLSPRPARARSGSRATSNRWTALTLDEDILYVREDRVLAFDGSVSWEAGRIPGDGLRMLQFRGRGQVVLQLDGLPAAIRISEAAPARVARGALLGWVGRVVAHRPRREGPMPIVCEGDGVMLLEARRSSV